MDKIDDLDVNTAIWRIFLNVTLQAAFHLGQVHADFFFDLSRINSLRSVKRLFQTTEKLTTDLTEITGLITIGWKQLLWRENICYVTELLRSRTPKTYFFSDSVLCLGGISDRPVEAWENR